ncbi:MAG: caspase family protein [Nitrospiraceae bacterium]
MRSHVTGRFLRSISAALALSVLSSFTLLPTVHAQVGKPEGLYYKSWAVVIGIENYLVAPKAPGAIEGAKAVATSLRELGFDEVIELYDKDASSKRLMQILSDYLPRKVGRQDRVVIFFSGHGVTTQDAQAKELGDAQVNNATGLRPYQGVHTPIRLEAPALLLLDAGLQDGDDGAPTVVSEPVIA